MPRPPAAPETSAPRKVVPQSPAQKALLKLGLRRDIDLALHLPLRYEDETRITLLKNARDGAVAQIEATVTASEITMRPRRQLVVTVEDESGTCELRFFSFYPSHQKTMAVGARLRIRGEIKGGFWGRQMLHPAFRVAGGELPAALTPVYPTVAGLPQPYLRRAVLGGLARADLSNTMPTELPPYPGIFSSQIGLQRSWGLRDALSFLHHPTPDVSVAALEDHSHPAWQRLKAEELLAQQLSQLMSRRERDRLRAPVLQSTGAATLALHEQLLAVLPFQLTAAQRRVGDEIAADLARPVPMHRLLQGDVGSGKTVVAALAATLCIDAGWQCALMAPTEILAEQHFRKLIGWLEPLLEPRGLKVAWLFGGQKKKERDAMLALVESGQAALAAAVCIDAGWQCALMAPTEILAEQHFRKLIGWLEPLLAPRGLQVAWLFGGQKKKERDAMLALVASGEAALVVGTHAVIQERVVFKHLALAIIDEQHRFGVAQRLELRGKLAGGMEPHLLMMSATPIPRTLAMGYYADLDVSTIDELPPGRTPIVTKLVSDSRRDEVVERIADQVAQGRQVYWVCPLIEESEALDLTNATATHESLAEALPGVLVGLLHSRMAPAEKKAVMGLFIDGTMGVLVSTTVIEVGVDVPNASLMVIEHAERFGLSQLHQLRGRVGRGAAASACVLLYATNDSGRVGETAKERLRAMAETTDGFEIARRDLEIRGPGEFLGARQSGAALLRFADLETDVALLEWAREVAPQMLDRHPEQAEAHVARWLGTKAEYLKA